MGERMGPGDCREHVNGSQPVIGRAKNSARRTHVCFNRLPAPVLSRSVRVPPQRRARSMAILAAQWMKTTPRCGSKPARINYRHNQRLRRAEFFALPIGGLLYAVGKLHYPSPHARPIINNPAPITTTPMPRATRPPEGAKRSAVMATVTAAIVRRSITPMTRRIVIKPAQQ